METSFPTDSFTFVYVDRHFCVASLSIDVGKSFFFRNSICESYRSGDINVTLEQLSYFEFVLRSLHYL